MTYGVLLEGPRTIQFGVLLVDIPEGEVWTLRARYAVTYRPAPEPIVVERTWRQRLELLRARIKGWLPG